MRLREFLNTCQNDWEGVCLYYDEEAWEDTIPDFEFTDVRECDSTCLGYAVDAWYMDANWKLHILLAV